MACSNFKVQISCHSLGASLIPTSDRAAELGELKQFGEGNLFEDTRHLGNKFLVSFGERCLHVCVCMCACTCSVSLIQRVRSKPRLTMVTMTANFFLPSKVGGASWSVVLRG